MTKDVQFLEIGSLTKSQLNPCRSRKVMIQNVNSLLCCSKNRKIYCVRLSKMYEKSQHGVRLIPRRTT